MKETVMLYHRTSHACADSILAAGFRDGEVRYGTELVLRGVWVSDRPLDSTAGDTVLQVSFLGTPKDLDLYECVEDGKPYREWLLPAQWLNKRCSIRMAEDEL